MNSKHILIVEDEISISSLLKLNLELEGFQVECIDNGKLALNALKSKHYDLAILDVMLPDMDGYSICTNIRALGINTPILFLTAKNDGSERVKGLKAGGDDYLGKPFNLEELVLRVNNLINRFNFPTQKIKEFTINKKLINFENYLVTDPNNFNTALSKKEMALLKLLINKKGKVVSREEILDFVWEDDKLPSPRTIDNFILNFRKIFEDHPKEPVHFISLRGVGYMLT